jgi:3,4-dihydroxy 2-butanone 4-phosphate synthase/GTP cyclohydrolase II
MSIEKLCFCDVPTALEEIRAGRVLAIVNEEENVQEGSLVMASTEPSPDTVRFMLSATSGLACMAVPEVDLQQVDLPTSLRRDFTLGAVFPNISEATPDGEGPRVRVESHIIPFTTRKSGVLRHARPAECIADLSGMLGGEQYCFFSTFPAGHITTELHNVVRTHSLKILSITELIRYRLLREKHVRSKSAFLVRSRHGEFRFHCVESDVIDRCAVLVKGDEHEFGRRPPLARIERIPMVGGMCTCLPTCMETSFEETVEMMHRDGHGIIVFMPSMRDCSQQEVVQKFTMDYFKDDPFSTLDDCCVHRVTSAGVCAQILRHLGAKCVRIVSNRPQRMRDLESFGIHIIEEVGIGRNQQRCATTAH